MKTLAMITMMAVAMTACGEEMGQGLADGATYAIQLDAEETAALLQMANTLHQSTLDDSVRLDARAAYHIVHTRETSGAFTTLAELDAVAYVGETALHHMLDWADENGWVGCTDCQAPVAEPVVVQVNGVEEGSYAAVAILRVASRASQAELDDQVGLDARAAAAIVRDRQTFGDFHSLARLDRLAYVGTVAFDKLLDHAEILDLVPFCGDGVLQPSEEACDGGPDCSKTCEILAN